MFEWKLGKFSRTAELLLSWYGLICTLFILRNTLGNEGFIFWKYSLSQRTFISQWETILLAFKFTLVRLFRCCVGLHCDRIFLYFFILYIFLHFSLLHFTAETDETGEYPVLGDSMQVFKRGGDKCTKISKGTAEVWKGSEWVIFCLFFSSSNKIIWKHNSRAPGGIALWFWETLSKAHIWVPVLPFN